MKYQPRYVAYLALIGGEQFATNQYFMSFIGVMVRQYEVFRGVPEETPISDHKEFTGFIQQWVRLNSEGPYIGIDIATGKDKTVMVEAKRDDDVLILGNEMREIDLNPPTCNNCGVELLHPHELDDYCSEKCENAA